MWGLSSKHAQLWLKSLAHICVRLWGMCIPLRAILAAQNTSSLLSRWLGTVVQVSPALRVGSASASRLCISAFPHAAPQAVHSEHSSASSKGPSTLEFYAWQIPGCKRELSNHKERACRCSGQFPDPINNFQEEQAMQNNSRSSWT